jgi:flagellar assembly protein FliH
VEVKKNYLSKIFESFNIITESSAIIIDSSGHKFSGKSKNELVIWEEKINELKEQYRDLEESVDFLESQKAEKIIELQKETENLRKKLIAEAETEKADIIAQAETEAIEIKEKVKSEGYEEGYETGKQESENVFLPILNSIEELIKNFEIEKESQLKNYTEDIKSIIIAVAKKIIKQELSTDNKIIINNINSVIEKISECKLLKIFVNPNDIQLLQQYKKNIESQLPGLKKLTIYPEENIMSGGCKIETEFGSFDASIEQQISEIESEFKDTV